MACGSFGAQGKRREPVKSVEKVAMKRGKTVARGSRKSPPAR